MYTCYNHHITHSLSASPRCPQKFPAISFIFLHMCPAVISKTCHLCSPPQSLPTPYHLLIHLIVPSAIIAVPCSPPQQLFFCLAQNIKYLACRARQSLKKFARHRTSTSGPGPLYPVHSSRNYTLHCCGAPGLFRTLSLLSEGKGCSICTCGSRLVSVKQCPMAKRSSACSFLLPHLGHGLHR